MANNQKTLLALLVGTVIGAGVGLLYAPNSGRETRRRMAEGTREVQEKASKKFKETNTSLAGSASKILNNLESKVDETLSSVSLKADGILNSMESKLEELRKQNKKFQMNQKSIAQTDSAIASDNSGKKETKSAVTADNSDFVNPSKKSVSS